MMRGASCSSRGPSWFGVVTGLLAATLLATACGKKAPATAAPAEAGAMSDAEEAGADADWAEDLAGEPAEDSLADAQAELSTYEDSMLEAGVELPQPVMDRRTAEGKTSTKATTMSDTPAARCERICSLATNVCALRDKICSLADEHEGEQRYADVCERASLDCERATQACEGCSA